MASRWALVLALALSRGSRADSESFTDVALYATPGNTNRITCDLINARPRTYMSTGRGIGVADMTATRCRDAAGTPYPIILSGSSTAFYDTVGPCSVGKKNKQDCDQGYRTTTTVTNCEPGSFAVLVTGTWSKPSPLNFWFIRFDDHVFTWTQSYCLPCPPGSYNPDRTKLGAATDTERASYRSSDQSDYGSVVQQSTCRACSPDHGPMGLGAVDVGDCTGDVLRAEDRGDPVNPITCDFVDERYFYSDGLRKSKCTAAAASCAKKYLPPGDVPNWKLLSDCKDEAAVDVPVLQLAEGVAACPAGHFAERVRFALPAGVEVRDYCVACASGTYQPRATSFSGTPVDDKSLEVTALSTCKRCPYLAGVATIDRTEPQTGATSICDCAYTYSLWGRATVSHWCNATTAGGSGAATSTAGGASLGTTDTVALLSQGLSTRTRSGAAPAACAWAALAALAAAAASATAARW